MIQCYEIQDGIDEIKSILSDKCKVVSPKQVFYIMELIDAIRRCIEEEGEGNENAVLYIPQVKSDSERRVARENINAVSREEMIQYIIDNSTYLAEQLGYELISNKQNDLTPDGTGTKYPTVDAVNTKVQELEENINNVSGDKNFTYHQNFPSATWEIIHNLNKKPSVTVTDSADTVVEGQIIINDGVKVLITFNAPFTGIAILN